MCYECFTVLAHDVFLCSIITASQRWTPKDAVRGDLDVTVCKIYLTTSMIKKYTSTRKHFLQFHY